MADFDDSVEKDSFPSGKFERGKIAASTGLKMGANYARYVARKSMSGDTTDARKALHERNARDLFSQLTKLRGTALKMAQGLSLETGFLPEEFSTVLSQAQYSVPPMNPALVRRLIKQSLGDYPENIFRSFEPRAVAAASLGQVHRAVLPDGRIVAIKVQYPNVRESIDSDLNVMRGIVNRIMGKGAVDPYLQEVAERLFEETDYILEGQNIEFFAEIYAGDKVVTPRWIPEYTTRTVLTMTFVEGLHLDKYLETNPSPSARNHYGQILWDFAHAQITGEHLAVHADAHPGNFLFRSDGRIGILDFGCVKRFPLDFRNDLVRLFAARLDNDVSTIDNCYRSLEFLREDFSEEQELFLRNILDRATEILVEPYRDDYYDFGNSNLLDGFKELMPQLMGRDAFKHRAPVGSHHFVFVNRLVLGFFTMLSGLGARVEVVEGREKLLSLVRSTAS